MLFIFYFSLKATQQQCLPPNLKARNLPETDHILTLVEAMYTNRLEARVSLSPSLALPPLTILGFIPHALQILKLPTPYR
jgi:hypothetical protein